MPLNGDLIEEVYIQPPLGYNHPSHKVCHPHRTLYGLKQASKTWFATFSSTIAELSFISSLHNPALFIHKSNASTTLLFLYVDDMIFTRVDVAVFMTLRIF